jgi:hypothetical protein
MAEVEIESREKVKRLLKELRALFLLKLLRHHNHLRSLIHLSRFHGILDRVHCRFYILPL